MPEDPQMITDRIQKAHAGETMSDIETPEETNSEQTEQMAFTVGIANVLPLNDEGTKALILLADGTVRWANVNQADEEAADVIAPDAIFSD